MTVPTHEKRPSLWRRLRGPKDLELMEAWSDLAERGEPVPLSYSTKVWGAALSVGLGFVGLVVVGVLQEGSPGLLVPGLIAVALAWMGARRLLVGHPVVVVETRGVYVDSIGQLVPWSEIHRASWRPVFNGPNRAYLDVGRAWADEHTRELTVLQTFGVVVPVRKGHTRINLPAGLACEPAALAYWIDGRPYEPEAEHLVAVIGIDKLSFAPFIDPSLDDVSALVLRLSEGKRAHLVVSYMPSGDLRWLELGREAVGQPVSMAEHRGDDEVWRRDVPDVATAAEQAVAWVREQDAAAGR